MATRVLRLISLCRRSTPLVVRTRTSLVLYANVALQAAVQGMTLALRALPTASPRRQAQALNILSNFSLYSRWKSAV